MADDILVTLLIEVKRSGEITSDIKTHDNCYSDVALGLAAVKNEIDRVFAERKNCPFYPKTSADAKKRILRDA